MPTAPPLHGSNGRKGKDTLLGPVTPSLPYSSLGRQAEDLAWSVSQDLKGSGLASLLGISNPH